MLNTLYIAQMCRFFSFFAVRSLLVLYLIQFYTDSKSIMINALLCFLVKGSGIFGGILADRYLGLKKAITYGSFLLAAGFALLLFKAALFPALALIVMGSSLFVSNLNALFGQINGEGKRAFTRLYMLQNLGALSGVLFCGWIAKQFGFQMAFAIAAFGMVIGSIALYCQREKTVLEPPKNQDGKLSFELFKKLVPYLAALILFVAGEDQLFSSLMLFTEREVDRTLLGIQLPTSVMMCMNPVVIILFGSLIGRLKIGIFLPFFLMATSFGTLALFLFFSIPLSLFTIILMVSLISLSELMVGPVIMNYAAEISQDNNRGSVMGFVSIAYALAYILSGFLGNFITLDFKRGFFGIALLILVSGLIFRTRTKKALPLT